MDKQLLKVLLCWSSLFFPLHSYAEPVRDTREESLHLRSIDVISYRPQYMKNGRIVSVVATRFDRLNTSLVREKGAAGTDELARFLQANRAILGDTSDLTFKLQRYGETSKEVTEGLGRSQARVTFVQVVNGLEMPISTISLVNGRPTNVSVKLADQDDPTFDRSNWISEESLQAIAAVELEKVAARHGMTFESPRGHYNIVEAHSGDIFEVVYEVYQVAWLVRVNALTGAVVFSNSLVSFATP